MIIENRAIIIRLRFLHELALIELYIKQNNAKNAHSFVADCFRFIEKRIAPHPHSFPEYKGKKTKTKIYRRAIFKKKYVIIYKVLKTKLEVLLIYHSSRDPNKISI